MQEDLQSAGVEVSRSEVRAVLLGENGGVAAESKAVRDVSVSLSDNIAAAVEGLPSKPSALGVAIPGLVDRRTGRIAFSAGVPAAAGTDLAAELGERLGAAVTLENDANSAAYAEFHAGAGRGCRDMFYATLGDGVGGALILDSKLWHGTGGFAGEFGYVTINSEGMRLEDVASSHNIVRRTRERFHQDSTSSLNRLAEEAIDLNELIKAAQNDDDFAQLMLARTGTYVGTGIAMVINLLNIERIVVGGAIMEAKHLVLDAIISRAREFCFKPSFESTTIVDGELGANAAAIGAAMIANERAADAT